MKRTILCFLLLSLGFCYAQQGDTLKASATGKIKLGMKWDALKTYIAQPPATEPATKWCKLKAGFDAKYLGFPITEVTVLFDQGMVTKIQMNFGKYDEDFAIEEKITQVFGPRFSTDGTGDMWMSDWVVGKYYVELNGGEQVSQYYLYLSYKE